MARALSSEKRNAIVETSKRLFAQRGFGATSVADIARDAEVPVGSIYTYFTSKEDLVRSIVDEGWSDLSERLKDSLASAQGWKEQIRLLLETFLPELLADLDFITILLTEGIEYTRMEEKAQELSALISSVIGPIAQQAPNLKGFTDINMEVALFVYLLGILGTVRISRAIDLSVTTADVLDFLRQTIQNALGVEL